MLSLSKQGINNYFVSLQQKNIHYQNDKKRDFKWLEKGEGHPIILLHGLMGGVEDLERW